MPTEKLLMDPKLRGRSSMAPTKMALSMADLDASLDSFLVEPAELGVRGRVYAAEITEAANCTLGGFTCNEKCGETGYWQCGPTSIYTTCGFDAP
ncbi:hypothetical protein [Longimicrobium terrae]|uniref:Uncharacterized protein n=1 Tax=Longimicrobium terrae TaxID=1639882 RepID=A0A841GUM4_9BACT|nr:hypothetical protein [Longimicrobium terrae]MBB4634286.1 hypothetical protein [Longimicrobium terrae]MBB6068824.1 hypothetical protein [Longimicrobium terrae]